MQFVIAGDYTEYHEFLRQKNVLRSTTRYIFISDPMRLYGLTDVHVLCVGHYWQSPVYQFHHKSTTIRFVDESGREVTTQPPARITT